MARPYSCDTVGGNGNDDNGNDDIDDGRPAPKDEEEFGMMIFDCHSRESWTKTKDVA
jgi:hypothetical protein